MNKKLSAGAVGVALLATAALGLALSAQAHNVTPTPATALAPLAFPTGGTAAAETFEAQQQVPIITEPPAHKLRCYQGGNAFQVLYLYPATGKNRIAGMRPFIQSVMEDANGIMFSSTGGKRQFRVFTTSGPDCKASVTPMAIPTSAVSGADPMTALHRLFAARGWLHGDRKYVAFIDYNHICGVGDTAYSTVPGYRNPNNAGPMLARIDLSCWQGHAVAHEMIHTLGAVLPGAPHGTRNGHCTDGHDIMCYQDGPNVQVRYPCSNINGEFRLDCHHDTYFALNPAKGSWLATHWNTARSSFLYGGGHPFPFYPPSAVKDLHIASITQTAATIRFGASTGGPTRYLVWAAGWPNWRYIGLDTHLSLSDLKPGTTYHVAVAAENKRATSHVATVTFTTKAAPAPSPSPTLTPTPTPSPSPSAG